MFLECSIGELALNDTLKCQSNGYTCTDGDGKKCCNGTNVEVRSCIPCDQTRRKKPKMARYTTPGTCDFESNEGGL